MGRSWHAARGSSLTDPGAYRPYPGRASGGGEDPLKGGKAPWRAPGTAAIVRRAATAWGKRILLLGGGQSVLHVASLVVSLSVLWLLLSGFFTDPLLLGLGAVSVVAVALLAWRAGIVDAEGHPVQVAPRALLYWPWLIKEIVVANIDVAKAICRSPMAIEPRVIKVKASQKDELGRVIYANSITLTPGTVTIALEGDELTVHALTKGSVEGLESGEMDRRVSRVAGSA